jgi:hypothetical protein
MSICPNQDDGWKQQMKAMQKEHATNFVVEVSRMDFHLEKGSFSIDKGLPLATLDLLSAIMRVFRRNDGFSHHFSELTPLLGQGVGDRSLGQPPC